MALPCKSGYTVFHGGYAAFRRFLLSKAKDTGPAHFFPPFPPFPPLPPLPPLSCLVSFLAILGDLLAGITFAGADLEAAPSAAFFSLALLFAIAFYCILSILVWRFLSLILLALLAAVRPRCHNWWFMWAPKLLSSFPQVSQVQVLPPSPW